MGGPQKVGGDVFFSCNSALAFDTYLCAEGARQYRR